MNKILIRRIQYYFVAYRETRPSLRGTGNTPHEAIGHLFCLECKACGNNVTVEFDMKHEHTESHVVMNGLNQEIL